MAWALRKFSSVHYSAPVELFRECHYVLMSRTPEAVDTLGIVADHHNIAVISGKMICNIALNRIGVLVFVDHDVPISVAEAFPYLVVFKKDLEVTYSPTKPGDGL